MPEPFDPYHRWLGIPLEEQPPNHYRLLGIQPFESNRDVIDSVAFRHISYLQEITDGPHVREAQRLLNELVGARRCLLDPETKAIYDAELKTKLADQNKPPKAAPAVRAQRSEKEESSTSPPPKVSQRASAPPAASQKKPPVAATAPSKKQERHGQATEQTSKKPTHLIVGGVAAALAVLVVVAGLFLLGGGDEEDENRQTKETTERVARVDQAARKSKPSASVDTKSVPDDIVAKADPDTTPLPDVRVEKPADPEDSSASPQTQNVPSAVAIPSAELPGQIDSLLLWLDASDSSSVEADDNALFDKWKDKSGKGCHATADGADRGPELVPDVLGGHSVARFSGSQCLQIESKSTLFKMGAEYTFIFVARGQDGTLLSKGSGDSAGSIAMRDGVASLRSDGKNLNADGDNGKDFRVRAVVADEDSLRWHVDGQPNETHSTAEHSIQSTSRVRIGAFQKRGKGLHEFFDGELAELLVYNRTLADDERLTVEAYLREKWLSDGTPPLSMAKAETSPPEEVSDDTNQPDPAVADTEPEVDDAEPAEDGEVEPEVVLPHAHRFVVLTPIKAEATAGSALTVLDDGVILADGTSKSNEAYRITAEIEIAGMTALCLEAMPHDDLPGSGPGYGIAGRFSLADFKVNVRAKGDSDGEREVSFAKALADDGDAGVERLIDGNAKTSWSVRRRGERVAVALIPAQPIGGEGPSVLTVTLLNRENLGCFRLLATSAPKPEELLDSGNAIDGEQDDRFALFVNVAGDAWVDPEGNAWVKSKDFDGATFGHEGGQSVKHDDEENPVAKTAQRGLTAFRAIVPNGTYEVRLYFSEHWTTDPKRRMFAAFVEQQPARPPMNIFHGPGLGSPDIYTIPKATVTDGRLDVDFQPANEDASTILNGISIRQFR